MECAICLEPIINREKKTLNCNHSFHKNCVDLWLKEHNTCPYCRELIKFIKVKIKRKYYKVYINPTNIVFEKNNQLQVLEFKNIKMIKYDRKKKVTIIKRESNNTETKMKLFSKNGYYIFDKIKNYMF
tara:strand:- start:47 stop:430 length:384 start_codon:yes stop_codon:yes gene_type:complete